MCVKEPLNKAISNDRRLSPEVVKRYKTLSQSHQQ